MLVESEYPEKYLNLHEPHTFSASNLPIEEVKQDFEHLILNNDVVVIQTSTGTGKSTQIPKFIIETLGHKTYY